MTKIETVANYMAESAMGYKRPYNYLNNLVHLQSVYGRYLESRSELIEAQFAAINILKNRGVEKPKRSPLSSLSRKEREIMRLLAKDLAAHIQRMMADCKVSVTKRPIKYCSRRKDDDIEIEIRLADGATYCFIHPFRRELLSWADLSSDRKILCAARIAERYKPRELRQSIEVVKADLESLLDLPAADRPNIGDRREDPEQSAAGDSSQ